MPGGGAGGHGRLAKTQDKYVGSQDLGIPSGQYQGEKKIFCSVLGLGLFFLLLFIPNYIYFLNPVPRCNFFFSFKSVINSIMAAQGDSQSDMTPRHLCRIGS